MILSITVVIGVLFLYFELDRFREPACASACCLQRLVLEIGKVLGVAPVDVARFSVTQLLFACDPHQLPDEVTGTAVEAVVADLIAQALDQLVITNTTDVGDVAGSSRCLVPAHGVEDVATIGSEDEHALVTAPFGLDETELAAKLEAVIDGLRNPLQIGPSSTGDELLDKLLLGTGAMLGLQVTQDLLAFNTDVVHRTSGCFPGKLRRLVGVRNVLTHRQFCHDAFERVEYADAIFDIVSPCPTST